MSNPITSALGTQRQFTKQPETPYQKRLITPSFGGGISVGANNDATLLASSLGLLGSGLIAESIAADKRAEKIGKAEADRIFSVTSEKDREKLSTIDILGQSGKFDIADNPYAVARIDELRGQHLNTLFKQEYETEVVPNQALPDNSQQNIMNYENFMAQKLKDSGVKAYNQTAFEKGFYGSRPLDVLQQDANYRKRRQNDLEADRDAAIVAKVDGIIKASINTPPDVLARSLQDLQLDEQLASYPLSARIKLANNIAKEISNNGDTEQLNAYGETILGHKTNGSEIRVKDVVPMGDMAFMALKANDAMFAEKTRKWLEGMKDLSSSEIPAYFEQLKKDDPVMYRALSHRQEGLIKAKKHDEQVALRREHQQRLSAYESQSLNDNFRAQLDAFFKGYTMDSGSHYVGKIYKVEYDSKGVPREKQATQEDLAPLVESEIARIGSDASLNDQQKAQRICKMLSFPPLKFYAKDFAGNAVADLHTLDTPNLSKDADGNYVLPPNLSTLLRIRKQAGNYAEEAFGDSSIGEIDALCTLQSAYGWNGGINIYGSHIEDFKDKEKQAVLKAQAKTTSFALKAQSLDGSMVNLSDIQGEIAQARAQKQFVTLLTCGYSMADAKKSIEQSFKGNNYVYKNSLIPKSVFEGFNTSMCKERLDYLVKDYCDKNGVDPVSDYVIVSWDNINSELHIGGGTSPLKKYTTSQLRNELEYYSNLLYENSKKENVNAVGLTNRDFSGRNLIKNRMEQMEEGLD